MKEILIVKTSASYPERIKLDPIDARISLAADLKESVVGPWRNKVDKTTTLLFTTDFFFITMYL